MTGTIERLPNEVLSRIFRIISDDHGKTLGAQTIHALRLVSRRVKSIATAFLIQKATVSLSTESFSNLEQLCRHPEFRLSIRHVRIDASFYDVQMAEDRAYFARHCASNFYRALETWERSGAHKDPRAENKLHRMWGVPDKIRGITNEEFSESSATAHQRIIMDYHKEYRKLTSDQEEVRRDNNHLRRLCGALAQLPALETIRLDDRNMGLQRTLRALKDVMIPIDDPRNLVLAIEPSMWYGSFETAYRTKPPLEMLAELFASLARSNVRPRSIHIVLSIPADLSKFQVSEEQAGDIHSLVSKTKDIVMTFDRWARKGSLAENNDRSVAEMSALGSVTRALTTTSTLKSLSLTLSDYPAFYQFPTVSMNALLPLRTIKWPSLQNIQLKHVPMDMDDLVLLLRSQRDTITSLAMEAPFLRTNDWDEAIEHLASELKKLEHVSIRWPKGGRYGGRFDRTHTFPEEQVCQYILGKSLENPLKPIAELAAP